MTIEESEIADIVVAEGGLAEGSTRDYDRLWDMLAEARDRNENIPALVIDATKGGLVVDLGARGFIPKSQIATRNLNNLERFIGETLDVKVVEIDRDKGRVVLSERKSAEEKRAAQRAETMTALEVGQVVDGVVRRIAQFGAFVDIGGVDGLLHISDLAWEQVEKTEDIVEVGQTVQVKILKIEKGGEKISLGLKQLQDDPWKVARREFREGQVIEVTVTRIMDFGAFAQIAPGVEGLIPSKELTDRRGVETLKLEPGQTVSVKIMEMPPHQRKISLSIRQAVRDGERKELQAYMTKQRAETATPTLGDLFGDVFSKFNKD